MNKYVDVEDSQIKISLTTSLFILWAFFSPVTFGNWVGTLIHTIRTVGGI